MDHDGTAGKSNASVYLAGFAMLALLGIAHFITLPHVGLWQRSFFDALHVPLFGLLAVGLLLASPTRWTFRKRLLVVAILVVILSVLGETAQIATPRDASFKDLIADWLGATGFGLATIALSKRFSIPRTPGRYLIMLGLAFVVIPLIPLAKISVGYMERNYSLPALARFGTWQSDSFYRLQNSLLTPIPQPGSDNVSAEISLLDGIWPGITFENIWPNWEAYSALVLDLENPDDEHLRVNIRIHDHAHRAGDQPQDDRFNRSLELAPGRHSIRIALAEVRNAPAGRRMDLADIDGVAMFCTRKEIGRRFILHDIRLD